MEDNYQNLLARADKKYRVVLKERGIAIQANQVLAAEKKLLRIERNALLNKIKALKGKWANWRLESSTEYFQEKSIVQCYRCPENVADGTSSIISAGFSL